MLAARTFAELGERLHEPPQPPPRPEPALIRIHQLIDRDPGGAWVSERSGELVGAALAIDRDGLWGLSLLVVDPEHQSAGLGRELLARSLEYAGGGRRGAIILASPDARALRAYARAGFAAHPCFRAQGRPRGVERPAQRARRRRERPRPDRARGPRRPRRAPTAATSRRCCAPAAGCS